MKNSGHYIGLYSVFWRNAFHCRTRAGFLGILQNYLDSAHASLKHTKKRKSQEFDRGHRKGQKTIRTGNYVHIDLLDGVIKTHMLLHAVEEPSQQLGQNQLRQELGSSTLALL